MSTKGTRCGLVAVAAGIVVSALALIVARVTLPEVGGHHPDTHVVVAGYAAGLSIVYAVLLDSYDSPDAEALLLAGEARVNRHARRRTTPRQRPWP